MTEGTSRYWQKRVSRRSLLRGGALLGAGLAGAALIGCGGDDDDDEAADVVATATTPAATPAATGTASGVATAAPADVGVQAVSGGTLRVALPAGPTYDSLDLNRTTGTWTHLEGLPLFDTLMVEDTQKNLVGSLATSWEWAEDFLSVVLSLKKGVKFHDGTDFTSENVRFLLDRVSDPENTRALAKSYLGPNYTSTEIIDEYTAKIILSAPNHTMLRRFTRAYFGITSIEAVEKQGLDDFARNPVGSGPWSFVEWIQSNRLVLERNDEYNWAPPIFDHQGPAYLDGITFQEIPDPSTRVNALESGDVDLLEEVPPVDVARFGDDDRFTTFFSKPQGEGWMIRQNTQLAPTDDLRVRQAFNHAINKEEIINVIYFDVHRPSYGPVSSASYGFNPNLEGLYPYDPNKAAELLDAAGWTMGANGVREKDGQEMEISYFSIFKDVGEVVQAQLRELGVKLTIDLIARGTESTNRQLEARDHLYDGGTQQAGFLNEDTDILRVIYHSSSIGSRGQTTFMGYVDDEFDGWLAKQQQTPRGPERVQLLQNAQQRIMDQALIIPIFDPNKALVASKDVHAVKIWPVNFYAFFYDAFKSS